MKNPIQKLLDFSSRNDAVVAFCPNGRVDIDGMQCTPEALVERIGLPANDNSEGFAVTLDALGYASLARVLGRAFDQAANGKGKERHANELPFDQQPMQTIAQAHGVGFLTGQAAKKSQEALGLPHDAKIRELLGAINYLAGAVIFLESQPKAQKIDFTLTPPKRQWSGQEALCGDNKAASMGRVGEVAANYCSRSGDKSRPICGECQPYGKCAGI